MDERIDRLPVVLHVDQHGRADLIPVPGVVPVVQMIGLDLSGVRIERDRRTGVEIIAGMQIARPGRGVADAPVRQVAPRVVVAGDPDGPAARLPRLALPGVAALILRARDRVGPPDLLAGVGVVGRDIGAHAELAAR